MDDKKLNISQLPKDHIFKAPDKYFEELPGKIQSQISTAQKSTIFYNTQMQWVSSLTAAIVIIFIGVFFFTQPDDTPSDLLAQVSADDIIEYLAYEDISTLEIASMIDIEDLIDDDALDHLRLSDDEIMEEDLELIYSEIDFSTEIM